MIIAVVNNKGGVGKSITAIHLAKYLARYKGPTTLIDGDSNATSLSWFNLGQEKEFKVITPGQKVNTPYVVLDVEGRPSKEDLKALANMADLAIVPCIPDFFSVGGTLSLVKDSGFKKLGVLLTICEPQGSEWKNAQQALESNGVHVFTSRIQRRVAYKKAQILGLTVADIKKDEGASKAWGDYVALGEEVCNG